VLNRSEPEWCTTESDRTLLDLTVGLYCVDIALGSESSSLVGFLRRDTSDTGKKSVPRSSILPITSCLVVASSMRAIHRMSKRNTRLPYAAATRPSPPPP
jgi:hypothetical protein